MDQLPDKDPSKEIDLKKILLPTKEVHTPASAERVNAGVLLEQEQKAELPKAAPAPLPTPPISEPKKDDSAVKPLETYQGDIESMVEKKNVSVLSIAAAEADKKREVAPAEPAQSRSWMRAALYVGTGVLLILIVSGVWFYIATRSAPIATVAVSTQAPFITVDDAEAVPVSITTRSSLMNSLETAKQNVKISLGLIEQLDPVVQTTDAQDNTSQSVLGIQDLLTTLAPEIPQELTRTLQPTYLLGVHSYDENDAFLILQTDSYETAYAGMLAWETTMQSDLSPLFDRTPPVHANGTATSTASTTPSQSIINSSFTDQVVDNRDARVITNQYGDILLLWTFLDRNTIVITNNDATLREIITRVTTPATTGLPTQ